MQVVRSIISSLFCSLCLIACGGGDERDAALGQPASAAKTLQKKAFATTAANAVVFPGNRSDYTIQKTASGYTITENISGGTNSVSSVTSSIQFADATVNLGIGIKSQSIATGDLKSLIELYIAFFNRVPDADGLSYWIDQFRAGQTLTQIAESFYAAAVQYPSLTGYSTAMSNADFVRGIYKNVLGRSGNTAPPEEDVQYWAGELANGHATKGSLISVMLNSAHSFTNHPTWGWVPQLLDNKDTVANYFAIRQGLNYATPQDSISKTMAIASAVSASDTANAISLIGISDTAFNTAAAVDAWVSFSPKIIEVHSYAGDSPAIPVRVSTSSAVNHSVQVAVIDSAGVLSVNSPLARVGPFDYELYISKTLAPGSYSGMLEVRVCEDDPLICQKPVNGSPFALPYAIVVSPASVLKGLSALPQVPAWSTFKGNASHTGTVGITLDPAAFSRRWTWRFTPTTETTWGYAMSPVVTDSGIVYSLNGLYYGSSWALYAFSENTGQVLWRYQFAAEPNSSGIGTPTLGHVSPPAVAQGKVYVTSYSFSMGSFLWVFDQQSGKLLVKQPMESDTEMNFAPTPFGDKVYVPGGRFSNPGLYQFDAASGVSTWFSKTNMLPAADASGIYGIDYGINNGLTAVRQADGIVDFTISIPALVGNYPYVTPLITGLLSTVLVSEQHGYHVDGGARLIGFDLAKRSMKWEVYGPFRSHPVLANHVLYVSTNTALEARNPDSGALLWSWAWTPPAWQQPDTKNDVIATNNLVFISAGSHVYAIDIASHKPVWQYYKSGELAISQTGVLYIVSTDGTITAFNLK